MTITTEQYAEALALIAEKEQSMLGEMADVFNDLQQCLEETASRVSGIVGNLPDVSNPSNIRATLQAYQGQVQSFLGQSQYMVTNTASMLAAANPAPLPGPAPMMAPPMPSPGPVPTPSN